MEESKVLFDLIKNNKFDEFITTIINNKNKDLDFNSQ